MMDLRLEVELRSDDSLTVRPSGAGVLLEAHVREVQIGIDICSDYAIRLRDLLIQAYPVDVTPTGRRRRSDRKSDEEKLASQIAAPGVQKTNEALYRWGGGEWNLVSAIAKVTGQTEMVVRANLNLLKRAGKVESRPSSTPSPGPQKLTEWRIVRA